MMIDMAGLAEGGSGNLGTGRRRMQQELNLYVVSLDPFHDTGCFFLSRLLLCNEASYGLQT